MRCLKITNEGKSAEVLIYDVIGVDPWTGGGVTAKQFVEDLKALGNLDQITVRINSPGGDVFEADAIYNALVRNKAKVKVEIDGLAASAASYISQAGDEIGIAENAMMMIHNAQGIVIGDAAQMLAMAELLDKLDDRIASMYAKRSGRRSQTWRDAMAKETWYTAEEAKAERLVDTVRPSKKAAAFFDPSRFKNAPAGWIEQVKAGIAAAEKAHKDQAEADAQAIAVRLRELELEAAA